MLFEPGAIAAPMNEIANVKSSSVLRIRKTSAIEAKAGAKTACTTVSALGIHVSAAVLSRSTPMLES